MLAAKDKDVVTALGPRYQAYVCFRSGEDIFTIVSFSKPLSWLLRRVTKTGVPWGQPGTASVARYKDGLSDDYRAFFGKWTKQESDTGGMFVGMEISASDKTQGITITDSEVVATYKWINLNNTTTTYTLKIRRSTKRGSETIQAPPPPTAKDKTVASFNDEDVCEYYAAPDSSQK
jgi:hypothetical protein